MEYFSTNWSEMTTQDWVGTVITVVVFCVLVFVYIYALRPKNREKLEAYKHIPLDDESTDSGEKNVG